MLIPPPVWGLTNVDKVKQTHIKVGVCHLPSPHPSELILETSGLGIGKL